MRPDTWDAPEIYAAFLITFTDCFFSGDYATWSILHAPDFRENTLGHATVINEGATRQRVFDNIRREIAEFGAEEMYRKVLSVEWRDPTTISGHHLTFLCKEEESVSHPASIGADLVKIGDVWRIQEVRMTRSLPRADVPVDQLTFFGGR